MPPIAAASHRQQLHSRALLCTLDALRVPFLIYGPNGRREHTSASAAAIFTESAAAAAILFETDRVAYEIIARRTSRLHIGPFELAHEVEMPTAGLRVNVYLLDAALEPWRAMVVITPLAGGRGLPIKGLTRRENEVAHLIGIGLSTKEIAQRLGISPHTTRHHTERIFARLGVSSRAGVAAIVGERCARGDDPPPSLLHHHLDEEALS